MLGPGDTAPEFELKDTGGAPFPLAGSLPRGAIALVFFKTSCPTCQYTLPFLERLIAGRAPGVPVLVAVSQDDADATEKFRQRFGLSFPALIDPAPQYQASNSYRITHVPSFFLIEPEGKISLAFDGFEKAGLEEIGRRFGITLFSSCDRVPGSRPG